MMLPNPSIAKLTPPLNWKEESMGGGGGGGEREEHKKISDNVNYTSALAQRITVSSRATLLVMLLASQDL